MSIDINKFANASYLCSVYKMSNDFAFILRRYSSRFCNQRRISDRL